MFWCFNARSDGFEGGEWGLLNQLGQPSERLEAACDVAQTVQENQALFNSVKRRNRTVIHPIPTTLSYSALQKGTATTRSTRAMSISEWMR